MVTATAHQDDAEDDLPWTKTETPMNVMPMRTTCTMSAEEGSPHRAGAAGNGGAANDVRAMAGSRDSLASVGGTAITGGVGSVWRTFSRAHRAGGCRRRRSWASRSLSRQIVFGVILVAAVAVNHGSRQLW